MVEEVRVVAQPRPARKSCSNSVQLSKESLGMFENIPVELREFKQWVCWKYEELDEGKLTKEPVTIHGKLASVTDPSTWTDFDTAVANAHKYSGIGFVLTNNDPYAAIDLDDCAGDEKLFEWQQEIFNAFDSYAELSPSGRGLHIIVKGEIPSGRRRNKVEVYSNVRYMTFTGNVYRNAAINNCHDLLNVLWADMGKGRNGQQAVAIEDQPQTDDDDVVIQRAANASNGEKFEALMRGDWKGRYQSQSDADFALIDIIAFYTQNRAQILRIFHLSALGKRGKAYRPDYQESMLLRAFDNLLPPLNLDDLLNSINDAMARKANAPVVEADEPEEDDEPGFDFDVPPGLIGEIAQYIYASSIRPAPAIAVCAALGLMAGICGRAYNTSTGAGLNQYILLLAKTGMGKESMATGIDKLIEASFNAGAVTARDYVGPAEIASQAALIKYMSAGPKSFVSVVGEFGLMLQQLSAGNGNANTLGLRRLYLDLYNKSGHNRQLKPSIYSDRDKNTDIITSPAFTLLGESTPIRFYEALDESMISEGLLPRFTIIEYKGKRPKFNEEAGQVQPSRQLIDQLSSLIAHCSMLNSANSVVTVATTPEADRMLKDFNEECDNKIDASDDTVQVELWNRAHLKALKLASLVAVGSNPHNPMIDRVAAEWALKLVRHDAHSLLARFERGDVGIVSEDSRQIEDMRNVILQVLNREYSEIKGYGISEEMYNDKVIPHVYLMRRLTNMASFKKDRNGAANAIKRIIQVMSDSGFIATLSGNQSAKYVAGHAKVYIIMPTAIEFNKGKRK